MYRTLDCSLMPPPLSTRAVLAQWRAAPNSSVLILVIRQTMPNVSLNWALLDFKRFTVERAVAAMTELLGADITAKAAALASRLANEDGAAVVADGVAQMLSLARPPRTSTKC